MQDNNIATPKAVLLLGYGGLIPFIAFTLAMLFDPLRSGIWRDTVLTYASVILSFVGALHWAFAMLAKDLSSNLSQSQRYAWSVVPALVGWFALLIPPLVAGIVLAVFFIIHLDQDRRLIKQIELPTWYLPLRIQLTLVATLAVVIAGLTAP
ncbi:MAG: DUF3429 domain-containing protein [Ferrovum sp. 37-45-19]|uniref:DUF3429 domain-containing protein n=1 Tax=Ferrovum sp. JA12 TaxID=1356299 RepID=UPI0007037706|nr:DUF3429 domain-containing protein [Ferrovum sp. JA12]OYV79484.1 MAG: DUF3429 domain-containing protein [Ferrovum sp. 21-44-67]OYV94227.1 MAG: DUF3429 domain-containing protein [Ferrovum sp. 37-45-19]OZB31741.1 MAG: DUF3429 domain-containing protein [Ferrovum sp. 34-44-207]HQT81701.1 DUF3429 domain-containing protein [Ferrovaceae bacterium]KRH78359.1 hypothetical protein FERRO_13430 [Ferrovum sp. JA12]